MVFAHGSLFIIIVVIIALVWLPVTPKAPRHCLHACLPTCLPTYLPPTTYYLLPTTHDPLPTIDYLCWCYYDLLLPTTTQYYLLPHTSYCYLLLHTTINLSWTSHNFKHTHQVTTHPGECQQRLGGLRVGFGEGGIAVARPCASLEKPSVGASLPKPSYIQLYTSCSGSLVKATPKGAKGCERVRKGCERVRKGALEHTEKCERVRKDAKGCERLWCENYTGNYTTHLNIARVRKGAKGCEKVRNVQGAKTH
jgi:hypothetical protein